MGGKKTCKYYKNCGNKENCLRCKGYAKEGKSNGKVSKKN